MCFQWDRKKGAGDFGSRRIASVPSRERRFPAEFGNQRRREVPKRRPFFVFEEQTIAMKGAAVKEVAVKGAAPCGR